MDERRFGDVRYLVQLALSIWPMYTNVHSGNLTNRWQIHHERRCISYWKGGISIYVRLLEGIPIPVLMKGLVYIPFWSFTCDGSWNWKTLSGSWYPRILPGESAGSGTYILLINIKKPVTRYPETNSKTKILNIPMNGSCPFGASISAYFQGSTCCSFQGSVTECG